ncbi:MAG: hypothetical protein APF77_23570 [Clostridia bacterium BRH_c25]|nr:MAG: hypothetical protein APF77_23570 [Clostridia bacterium BRH_c25]
MDYKSVEGADIKHIVSIWNSTIIKDIITEEILVKNTICDQNFDSGYFKVAVDNGTPVGFIIGIKRKYPYMEKGLQEDQAWILAIAVSQDYQHKGVGYKLLKDIEAEWKESGVSKIALGTYSPNYFFPGIWDGYDTATKFFIKHGYVKKESCYWMSRPLADFQIPEEIVNRKHRKELEGYSFIPFQWNYTYDLINFLKDNFSVGWRIHVINAVYGGTAEDTIILCIYKEKVAGYVQRSIDGDPSRFGPFGVGGEFRDKGLGSVLIHEMWQSMFDRNIYYVFFKSTEQNGRRFYERYGMKVARIFCHFEKKQ